MKFFEIQVLEFSFQTAALQTNERSNIFDRFFVKISVQVVKVNLDVNSRQGQ